MINTVKPYSCLSVDALDLLAQSVECAKDVPGAIAECGVANGGSAFWLWHVLGRNRELWLYDSWQGLPKPNPELDGGRACAKHDYKTITTGAMCRGEITNVFRLSQLIGIPIDLLHIIPGWFNETVAKPYNQPKQIAVLHLDGDWYESIMTPLVSLWPLVVTGGVVIFDDYIAWPGAKDAADKFAADNGLEIEMFEGKARMAKNGN